MKKSILKLIFSAFVVVMLFTSCLGGGNNVFERSGSFAYIQYDPAKGVYAAVDQWYITSPLIKNLEVGRCYFISYRTSREVVGDIYVAEDMAQPVLLRTTQGSTGTAPDDESFGDHRLNPTAFEPRYGSFDSFFGDNWGFAYRVRLKEKDTPRAYFYYDSARQSEMVEGVLRPVGKNQIIIDVRFDYFPGEDVGNATERLEVSVGNFSRIKSEYQYSDDFQWTGTMSDGSRYAEVSVRFRYNQLQSDGTTRNDVYVGQWSPNPYRFDYYE
jgi:hypothetical protein